MISLHQLPNQQRGEETRLFLRRHWIAVIIIFLQLVVLAGVPIVIGVLLTAGGFPLLDDPFWTPLMAVLLSIYLIFVLLIVMTEFTDYYLDTWIVTTEPIINIEHHGLFSRIISELHLNQIEDVTSETHGLLAFVLTYGDVYIQTAATRERFNFKAIDNPDKVKQTIIELVQADKRRHGPMTQ